MFHRKKQGKFKFKFKSVSCTFRNLVSITLVSFDVDLKTVLFQNSKMITYRNRRSMYLRKLWIVSVSRFSRRVCNLLQKSFGNADREISCKFCQTKSPPWFLKKDNIGKNFKTLLRKLQIIRPVILL